jgi:hypothetical protein
MAFSSGARNKILRGGKIRIELVLRQFDLTAFKKYFQSTRIRSDSFIIFGTRKLKNNLKKQNISDEYYCWTIFSYKFLKGHFHF